MKTRREAMVLFGGAVGMMSSASQGWTKIAISGAGKMVGDDGLYRAPPEKVGVDPDAVLAYLDDLAASGLELNSFMLYRKGAVAAEGWFWPYQPNIYHMLHSATKSFVGVGVGIAVAEGLFKLSDSVLKFFPDRITEPSGFLQEMTVESLLTQTSGHAIGISGSKWRPIKTSWVTEFLKVPVTYKPGTHFAYSSATSFMLSAIVTEITGKSMSDYLKPRLFEPIGMTNYHWDIGPENINPGGNGLSVTTADFAKLGVMMLQGGKWDGHPIIPATWAAASGKPTHGNAYGYQWWVSPDNLGYYAAGKFGQFTFVFPALEAVLTVTAGVADNLATREKMQAKAFMHMPLICGVEDVSPQADDRFQLRKDGLRALPSFVSGNAGIPNGVNGRTFVCADNDDGVKTIKIMFEGDQATFEMADERGVHIVHNGLQNYRESTTTITGSYLHHEYQPDEMRVVAGGRWTAANKFEMVWQFVESGFRDTATLTFNGDEVIYDRSVNVNSGPLNRPSITGHA